MTQISCTIVGLIIQCIGTNPTDPEKSARILSDKLKLDTRVTDELDKRILDREPLVTILSNKGWIDDTVNPGPSPYRLDGSLKSDPPWFMSTYYYPSIIIIRERY